MKINIIAVGGISLIVLFVVGFAGIFEIRLAAAQVDATSSLPVSTTAPIDAVASTSTVLIATISSSTAPITATSTSAATSTAVTTTTTASTSPVLPTSATTVATSTPGASTPAVEPPPKGLAKVHIIGTKYTDYFTDGKTVTAFPGDPAIDSHFDVPNAPIPTRPGLTWDHTSGGYLYDTPSGDLEVGDYAVQPSGSYIENAPPFVSSTSTAPTLPASATSSAAISSPASSTVLSASTSSTTLNSPVISSTSTETTTPSSTTTLSILPSDTLASTTKSSEPATPAL
jgi:hypothetical protein